MKNNRVYLNHILECINDIREFTSSGQVPFFNDRKTQAAVIRCFEIIGEATKRLSLEFRQSHPEIRWRDMAGMRDVLIHDYMEVDYELVWEVIEKDIPELERNIKNILNQSI